MNFTLKKWPLIVLSLFLSHTAYAAINEQIALDARAQALGNAVTADPPGIMAIHYNPGGLSLISEGMTCSLGLSSMNVNIKTNFTRDPDFPDFLGGFSPDEAEGQGRTQTLFHIPLTSHEMSGMGFPSYGVSYRKTDSRWTFAVGGYQPFFLGWEQTGENNPAVFDGEKVIHQHYIYAAPSASYQVSPSFSLGLSIGMGSSFHKIKTNIRMPTDLIGFLNMPVPSQEQIQLTPLPFDPPFSASLEPYDTMGVLDIEMEDTFAPSFNIGALWDPTSWLSFGLVYQSEVRSTMNGHYSLELTDAMKPMMEAFVNLPSSGFYDASLQPTESDDQYGSCTLKTVQPQRIQVGIKIQPFRCLKLLADLNWVNGSAINETRYVFDRELSILQFAGMQGTDMKANEMVLERHFQDTTNWSTGLEYDLTSWFCLRFGYEDRETSVDKAYYDLIYPIPSMNGYSAGFGITLKNGIRFDVAASYFDVESYEVANNTSVNMNSADWTRLIYNPFVGLDYDQDTEIIEGSFKITVPLGQN